ncbi:hypothetical protein ACS0TY_035946 [Phlomoides rotata]
MPKPVPHVVLFLLILSLPNSIFKLSYCNTILCPEFEKQALLSFKQSLKYPSNLLSSWNSSNCCNWKGVVCSNVTGNVHQLHLQGHGFESDSSLSGKINPSLLQLKHLKYLDLSGNEFVERIPSFMGSLTSLEYLDLSGNAFYGKIPHTIGNLSRLHTLDLGFNYGTGLDVDSVEWLRGLSQLGHLNMNDVNLTKAAPHWMQVINALPSLVDLRLSYCRLNFIFDPPSDDVNITSLAILDLSGNNFVSFPPIPNWIFKQSNLVYLDLGFNQFRGPIPTISNITKLQHIDLSGIGLNSPIPDWFYSCKDLEFVSFSRNSLRTISNNAIGNLTSLTTLDLSYNQLSGEIPRGILNLCKLQKLDLSENMLQGEISDIFGHMSDCFLGALTDLRLSGNQLSGEIPISLEKLSHLVSLYLSSNRLTGNLPMSMGRLSNLEDLDVRYNMMAGIVTESHFANLTKLRVFSANGNNFTLKSSPTWNPPFKLSYLRLASWNLGAGSDIPSWLETQKSTLSYLDLSNTGISGNVPSWFWEIFTLNITNNHLSGNIPDIIGSAFVHISFNQFSGPLPRTSGAAEINLSNNLFSGSISHFLCDLDQHILLGTLHLGGNKLSGGIPDCWMKWSTLSMVNLSDNNLSGSIPNSIGTLTMLRSLNLYDNKLSGEIPLSISNCTKLVKLDLSGNNLVGGIPIGIGTNLALLRFLILRSNKLRGTIPSSICHLNSLQIFDLSKNAFSGRIPSCVNNLTAMIVKRNLSDYIGGDLDFGYSYPGNFLESASVATKGRDAHYDTILSLVNTIDLSDNNLSGGIPEELTSLVELKSLNLSGNHLTGLIPKSIGDLKQLESLDFSRNALSGEMPKSFSFMSFLSYLNLSSNNLRGRIPESTQLQGMNASSFEGNNLCGPPLTIKCRGNDDDDGEDGGNDDKYQDDKSEIEWLYVLLSLGYALGLSAFCTVLVFKRSRSAYFGLLERMWGKFYVYYHITCRKLTRRRAQAS